MNQPLIIGNWKMNTTLGEAVALAKAVAATANKVGPSVDVGICPPYPWIVPVRTAIGTSNLQIGAQNCAATENGAHTGDVSATMLSPVCDFTLVGHSERRLHHNETDDVVRQQLQQAITAHLPAVLCVGESRQEHDAGKASEIVQHQLYAAFGDLHAAQLSHLTIAYEPVWCIGTGASATAADASDMAQVIRNEITNRFGSTNDSVRILYGGSANAKNASAFLAADHVDGLLVGGASLSADSFGVMIQSAADKG